MLAPALQTAVDALLAAMLETEEFLEYKTLKESAQADEANRILLQEYQKAQVVLQMTALAGREADTAAVERFSGLSDLLHQNNEIALYLLAQLKLQNLLGEVYRQLGKATGAEPNFPGV